MRIRRFRPGFHSNRFFGFVPPARAFVPSATKRMGIINTVLRGRVYALHGTGGKELEQVCASSLAEAVVMGRSNWGDGCRAVVLHAGDFEVKGRTLRVREGRIA